MNPLPNIANTDVSTMSFLTLNMNETGPPGIHHGNPDSTNTIHVRSLSRHFTQSECERTDSERLSVDADIDLYNRWHSDAPVSLWQRLRDLPTYASAGVQFLFSHDGAPFLLHSRLILFGFCALLYILSPWDVIPEVVAGFFGLIDDLLVFVIFSLHTYAVYRTITARPR
ncbi:hypothetical protein CRM22_006555 [Opisthorchis felineus]|uniref:DUF1232 domain-containing protein n=1 Tax=Opisthorchis felineus TaxID=147828 RepID=A0A4S2LRR6_OPIFE|nr:hypothetical protein CRM22_006555 [Opisthorchis felineus]